MASKRTTMIIPGNVWAVATVLLILTVAVHDVSMAASGHGRQSHAGASPGHRAESAHHASIGAHAHPSATISLAPCDPRPCPDFIDCSAVRVANPIPTSGADLELTAPGQRLMMAWRDPVAHAEAADRSPPLSPGVRRALLQVFLN